MPRPAVRQPQAPDQAFNLQTSGTSVSESPLCCTPPIHPTHSSQWQASSSLGQPLVSRSVWSPESARALRGNAEVLAKTGSGIPGRASHPRPAATTRDLNGGPEQTQHVFPANRAPDCGILGLCSGCRSPANPKPRTTRYQFEAEARTRARTRLQAKIAGRTHPGHPGTPLAEHTGLASRQKVECAGDILSDSGACRRKARYGKAAAHLKSAKGSDGGIRRRREKKRKRNSEFGLGHPACDVLAGRAAVAGVLHHSPDPRLKATHLHAEAHAGRPKGRPASLRRKAGCSGSCQIRLTICTHHLSPVSQSPRCPVHSLQWLSPQSRRSKVSASPIGG